MAVGRSDRAILGEVSQGAFGWRGQDVGFALEAITSNERRPYSSIIHIANDVTGQTSRALVIQ